MGFGSEAGITCSAAVDDGRRRDEVGFVKDTVRLCSVLKSQSPKRRRIVIGCYPSPSF